MIGQPDFGGWTVAMKEADLRYTHIGYYTALRLLLNVPRTKAYLSMGPCEGMKLEQTFSQQYVIVLWLVLAKGSISMHLIG